MSKSHYYGAKSDSPAEWMFYPNSKTRKAYPDAPGDHIGMDIQDEEVMRLVPKSVKTLKDTLVLEISEGRVELLKFDKNWVALEGVEEDSIVWDATRIMEAWSSDD